jgi:hypothetical protein
MPFDLVRIEERLAAQTPRATPGRPGEMLTGVAEHHELIRSGSAGILQSDARASEASPRS